MDAQEVVDKAVARSADSLHAVGRFLWENPETCFEEHKAHDVICTFLEGEGFQVKRHYALETAFRAEYGGILLRSEEAPNAAVCRSHLHFCVRSRTSQILQKAQRDVEACMEAAAKATGCAVKISEKGILSKHMHLNEPLLKVFQRRAEEQGATSDVGNVSHRLPTIHPLFRIESTAMNHTAEYSRVAGMRQSQERALVVGKALALTAFDLLRDQSILDAAWEHFERTRKELRD
ncbi:hypothetical protein V5799_029528 [Amblyomma americanum]|uniref:Uncharacterized protein n=1 Tax=Amblyomma americanum TaxID=6943 RepID=A0AAQ4EQW3_AMBAM